MHEAAVIGCGRMGAFSNPELRRVAPADWFPLSHAEAIASHTSLKLVSLADTNPDALHRAAQRYCVSRNFEDPSQLLRDVRPALVSIATRTVGRAGLIEEALRLGCSALHVEKPLCNSVRELLSLEAAFAPEGRFLTYGTIRRFLSPYRRAIALVKSGIFGELLDVQVNMGRGHLFWTHPHSVDLILFAAGNTPVKFVWAQLSNFKTEGKSNTVHSDPIIESAQISFTNGVEGRITRCGGFDFVLGCERGQVVVEADGHAVYTYSATDANPYFHREPIQFEPGLGGTLAPISHLVDCLDGNKIAQNQNQSLRRDFFLGQRILFAFVQSHLLSGAEIALNEVPDDLIVWAKQDGRFA